MKNNYIINIINGILSSISIRAIDIFHGELLVITRGYMIYLLNNYS